MADFTFGFKSSKKEERSTKRVDSPEHIKNFTGSLALRVFLISFICLILPLIGYSFMMYWYDFKVKQAEQAKSLDFAVDIQTFIADQLINFEFQTLEQVALYLQASAVAPKQERSKALQTIAQLGNIQTIFMLKKDSNNDVICVLSSNGCKQSPAYNPLFFLPVFKEGDYAVHMSEDGQSIYFIKVLERSAKKEVMATLNLCISSTFFIEYLTQAQGYHDIYKVFLFNKNKQIFCGQDPSFVGKTIVIDPQEDGGHAESQVLLHTLTIDPLVYSYIDAEGVQQYASEVRLAELNVNLLVIRPEIKESYYLQEFFYQTILLFVAILLLGGIGAWFLTYLMAKPLKRLCHVMMKVSHNDLTTRYRSCSYGFEINKVGEIFNQMIENLLQHVQEIQEQRIRQEMLQQELYIGHQIQKSLVPTQLPEVPGLELQALLVPAKEVGGDFYDFFVPPDHPDEVMLIMADTSGHGVFGCFYSLTMRSILRSLGSTIPDLRKVITEANKIFCKDSASTQVFVTAWIGSYNYKTHELRYSSCGHPLGFIFREGRCLQELATPGIALGVIEEMEPTIAHIQLFPKDLLVFVTDGVIEAHDPEGKLYGKKRLIEFFESRLDLTAQELCEALIQDLEHFEVDPENQHDDITLMIMRINQ